MRVHERLIHDAAFATALSVFVCIENSLRPEEIETAFDEIYQRVRLGIEAFVLHSQRQREQLNPMSKQPPG
jgi:hypothetical protein